MIVGKVWRSQPHNRITRDLDPQPCLFFAKRKDGPAHVLYSNGSLYKFSRNKAWTIIYDSTKRNK